VFYSFFLLASFDLLFAAVVLVGAGAVVRFRSRLIALALIVAVAVAAGSAVEGLFAVPPRYVHQAGVFVVLVGVAVVIARPAWNPVGQLSSRRTLLPA